MQGRGGVRTGIEKHWLKRKEIRTLDWPSQSPDLNPIEMLWQDLKRAVHPKCPSNLTQLFCKEKWTKIPKSRSETLVCGYRRRLVEVKAAKEGATTERDLVLSCTEENFFSNRLRLGFLSGNSWSVATPPYAGPAGRRSRWDGAAVTLRRTCRLVGPVTRGDGDEQRRLAEEEIYRSRETRESWTLGVSVEGFDWNARRRVSLYHELPARRGVLWTAVIKAALAEKVLVLKEFLGGLRPAEGCECSSTERKCFNKLLTTLAVPPSSFLPLKPAETKTSRRSSGDPTRKRCEERSILRGGDSSHRKKPKRNRPVTESRGPPLSQLGEARPRSCLRTGTVLVSPRSGAHDAC
ncbi:hypothetical protein CCH79_00000228 [Gambusia affinis]|uniref:Tc1-like transposase DDE domain-containing protein n=1 Tax=Gambusia affinis TaxID=33528 RepID=A0A315VWJ5_GAMAF|nr:hypothetical protein CCH79_00000228 [Gambusia affinis]